MNRDKGQKGVVKFIFNILLIGLLGCPVMLDAQESNCSDGIDNDGDGLIDCSDPDCLNAAICTTAAVDCTFEGSTFSFAVSGSSVPGYVDEFLLTDLNGVIQDISITNGFSDVDPGDYKLFHLNYHSTTPPSGNSIGQSIGAINGDCFEISGGFTIKVCPISTVNCQLDVAVWLEGPYQQGHQEMQTLLNDYQLLPGQDPLFFIGQETPAGQPYNTAPWNYDGTEGDSYDYNTIGDAAADYPADVVDWVLVSLRNSTDNSSTFCKTAAWVLKNGLIVLPASCDCTLTVGEEVYVVVEHRNHLPVMSPTPIAVTATGVGFDFRTQQSYKTFVGDGQKELSSGVFAMFGANGDQTGLLGSQVDINASDESLWTSTNSIGDIYIIGDFNLDGDVNANDESLWLNNTGKSSDVDFNN